MTRAGAPKPWAARSRTAEAMALLAIAGVRRRLWPIERWSTRLGVHAAVPEQWSGAAIEALPQRSSTPIEHQVARAVSRGGAHLPWTPSCLAEAYAAQVMLRRRGAPGVVVIGLRPGPGVEGRRQESGQERESGRGGWQSHAWVLGRRGALTGGAAATGFTATTVFEVPGALRAQDVDLTP